MGCLQPVALPALKKILQVYYLDVLSQQYIEYPLTGNIHDDLKILQHTANLERSSSSFGLIYPTFS